MTSLSSIALDMLGSTSTPSTNRISTTDKSAIKSAFADILSELRSGTAGVTGSASIGSRIDGLIDGEVTAGKLTGNQATDMKALIAKAGQQHHVHASSITDALGVSTATNAAAAGSTSTDGLGSTLEALLSRVKTAAPSILAGAVGIATGGIGSTLVGAIV